ncbi:hypothetical protein PVAP13_1NG123900 [Panicum virgatum]|uniref:Uncharacterized protein n=1 Tax=Panicum virgatum TaxID=38727 RepID=A0A8T0WNQ5_PANVG|nr:hypothetical protein PVAP13_1NG123900 [Panicum virgatum]
MQSSDECRRWKQQRQRTLSGFVAASRMHCHSCGMAINHKCEQQKFAPPEFCYYARDCGGPNCWCCDTKNTRKCFVDANASCSLPPSMTVPHPPTPIQLLVNGDRGTEDVEVAPPRPSLLLRAARR